MCTRYTLHKPDAAVRAVAESLGVTLEFAEPFVPHYNVAPSVAAPVILAEAGAPRLRVLRWALLPPADRGRPAPRMLPNARAESMTKLPAFRAAAAERRCLVPANGFYEFKDLGRRKEPYLFTLRDEAPFAFAGLWEPPAGEWPGTFCILTTEPNATVAPIHNRMPIVLDGRPAGPLARRAGARRGRPRRIDPTGASRPSRAATGRPLRQQFAARRAAVPGAAAGRAAGAWADLLDPVRAHSDSIPGQAEEISEAAGIE